MGCCGILLRARTVGGGSVLAWRMHLGGEEGRATCSCTIWSASAWAGSTELATHLAGELSSARAVNLCVPG